MSSPPFPVCDIAMIPGLLPIFLHSCEIKSGSGLRTRLDEMCTEPSQSQNLNTVTAGNKTTLSMLKHNIRWWVICISHILYTIHSSNCNSDTILPILTFSQPAVKFIYIVSAAVLQWLLSLRKHIIVLTNLQKLPCWVPVATCATTSGIEWSQIRK